MLYCRYKIDLSNREGAMATIKKIWTGKNGPLMIAEIGGNHEGNFKYAKKLTRDAIKCWS